MGNVKKKNSCITFLHFQQNTASDPLLKLSKLQPFEAERPGPPTPFLPAHKSFQTGQSQLFWLPSLVIQVKQSEQLPRSLVLHSQQLRLRSLQKVLVRSSVNTNIWSQIGGKPCKTAVCDIHGCWNAQLKELVCVLCACECAGLDNYVCA